MPAADEHQREPGRPNVAPGLPALGHVFVGGFADDDFDVGQGVLEHPCAVEPARLRAAGECHPLHHGGQHHDFCGYAAGGHFAQ